MILYSNHNSPPHFVCETAHPLQWCGPLAQHIYPLQFFHQLAHIAALLTSLLIQTRAESRIWKTLLEARSCFAEIGFLRLKPSTCSYNGDSSWRNCAEWRLSISEIIICPIKPPIPTNRRPLHKLSSSFSPNIIHALDAHLNYDTTHLVSTN